jgi:putative toxin-antitoxin system antitoxin component (TIGR02293 family)
LKERLRKGLPYASLEAVARRYDRSRDELVFLLSLPPRTLSRRQEEQRLRADESDRLFRVRRIAVLAEEILGSRDKARD